MPDAPTLGSGAPQSQGVRNQGASCTAWLDLEKAIADFEYWSGLWSRGYSENKQNRYDAEAKQSAAHLREVEEYLKSNGLLAYTDDELAQETLNNKYPLAKARDVVSLNGARYQKRFNPKTQ